MRIQFLAIMLLGMNSINAEIKSYELAPEVPESLYTSIIDFLNSTILPDTEYVDIAPNEFIEYLFALTRERSRRLEREYGISYFAKYGPANTPDTISIAIKDDNVVSALNKFCEKTQLNWWISSSGLSIAPPEDHK